MSYILDALKKSERARISAATSSQRMLLLEEGPVSQRRVWPWWVGALVLLNVLALWAFLRSPVGADADAKVERKALGTAQVAAAPAVPGSVARRDDNVSAPLAPAVPVSAPPPAVVADVAPAKPVAQALPPAPVVAKTEPVAPALRAGPIAQPTGKEAVKEAPPAPTAGEMPEALRRELPPLAVGGVMREQGAAALVVVNERPLREGEEVVPGLRVEKILEQGVQFSYKGYRFQR